MSTTKSHQAHPYTPRTYIWDRHVTKKGVLQIPVAAADGTPPAIIKVHAAYQYRVVDFLIQQRGAEPTAPSSDPKPGEVLKYENVALLMAGMQATLPGVVTSSGAPNPSEYVYTLKGRYVFLKSVNPVTQSSGQLSYPQAPFDTFGPQQCHPGTWQPGLLGDDSAPQDGSPTPADESTGSPGTANIPSSGQDLTIPSGGSGGSPSGG